MEKLDIVFDPLPPDAVRRFVVDSLDAHNIAATGLSNWQPVGFFLKSARGEWLGGLMGQLWGGWLYVRDLWWRRRHAAAAMALGCFGPRRNTPSNEAALPRLWRR
jgi:hypothetical protein